jgi:hypothetical protein
MLEPDFNALVLTVKITGSNMGFWEPGSKAFS